MIAGLVAPCLLELDGLLALQWRILGAMVYGGVFASYLKAG